MDDETLSLLENVISELLQIENLEQYPEAQEILSFINDLVSQTETQPPDLPPTGPSSEEKIAPTVEFLWNLSGGQPDAFVSYLREFPDPGLARLVNNPQLLASTIERLQNEFPQEAMPGATEMEDGIQHAPLQSSNVYGFKFNPSSKQLLVRFQNGSVYKYDGVPPVIAQLFASGNAAAKTSGQNKWGRWWKSKFPTLGGALNVYIKKGGYPYTRIK